MIALRPQNLSPETSMMYRMWEVVKAYQQLNDFEDATDALQQLLGEFKDTVPTFTGWLLV